MPRKPKKRPHGWGTVVLADNGTWRIRWREKALNGKPGRRRMESGYPTRDEAEGALNKIVSDVKAERAGREIERPPSPSMGALAALWIERRKKTHRSADEDEWRWKKHLKPVFGALQPDEIDAARLRRFIELKLAEGLSSSTVRLLVMELSSLFSDVVEQGHAVANPVKALPRATKRLFRPAHDPRTTPFVERLDDVRRIFLKLPEPVNLAYALGALAGLRNGEVLALRWQHVDMTTRRIHVRESIDGPLKDDDSRIVPIQDALYPLLAAWKLRSQGLGRVVPTMRSDGEFLDGHTIRKHLKDALEKLQLPALTWYSATRHTFASQWVMAGNSIEKLREIMGHSTVQVTERYAHLKPELFGAADRATMKVSLSPGAEVQKLGNDTVDVQLASG